MAEYTIDKIEYNGNVYKLQDNISGFITNIKTVNNQSLIGSGNINIQGGTQAKIVRWTESV